MVIEEDQLQIIEQAISGNQESLCRIAEIVQGPLRSYVLRIAFNEDLVDDIVQETLLEMFRIIEQLKQAQLFWPWLCKIALNKIRIHSRTQSHHQKLLKENREKMVSRSPDLDGLATVINEEVKQCILQAMSSLSERQKAVLSMRCYEGMSYARIAEVMGMSELGCRLQFIRGKQKLRSRLCNLGYGQKSLLFALALFGKLTASSEAAATEVCITPAMLSAGGTASTIALLTGKYMLTLAAGIGIVAGVTALTRHPEESFVESPTLRAVPQAASDEPSHHAMHVDEGYYLFPQGRQGPVMTRFTIHDADSVIQVLQNNNGNYFYDVANQTVFLNSYRYWKPDLSVMILPTDTPELESFLALMEDRAPEPRPIRSDSPNLFIVASGNEGNPIPSFGIKNYDALKEERFQYNWPARTVIRDKRDSLHQKGWCYFTVQGQINGKSVSGKGRLPLVYIQAVDKTAWLNISIAGERTVIDTPMAAIILDAENQPVSIYSAGTFFSGLSKPWYGLHTIDTVRRDAAQLHIPFETSVDAKDNTGIVRLHVSGGSIKYLIDMERDLVQEIDFLDINGKVFGNISFDYLNPKDVNSSEFEIPQYHSESKRQRTEPKHWLSELYEAGSLSK